MANDYLISKWKTWFSWFDHNKDGKVCSEDLETARNKFAKLHHLEAERRKAAMEKYTEWWSEYLMWGKPEITEEEFVNCQNEAFKADMVKFQDRMQRNEDLVCGFLDINSDGLITEEDFVIIFKSSGHGNEALDKKFFAAFNPVDGKVLVKTMSDAWTLFLTCEDSSKPDVVKAAFDGIPNV